MDSQTSKNSKLKLYLAYRMGNFEDNLCSRSTEQARNNYLRRFEISYSCRSYCSQ